MAFTSSTPSFVSANTPDTLPSSTVFSALARVLVRVSTPSFGEGPLYALMIHQEIALSLGGIITNRQWQVVGEGKQPIKNLYAIGADGQMVYLGLYNLNTSGGHMATNVESGRYAVKHALKTCF